MLKQLKLIIITSLIIYSFKISYTQNNLANEYLSSFSRYNSNGDLFSAEQALLNILKIKDTIPPGLLIATYNNLGVINNRLGRYELALSYLNSAEIMTQSVNNSSTDLADIYINKSRIYGILKEPDKAIEYLEQGLNIYNSIEHLNSKIYFRISTTYLNLGITYYEKLDYKKALFYLKKSESLRLKYNLADIALTYLNLAKVFVKLNDNVNAERYFKKSLDAFNKEFGYEYYRTTSVLFDYGLFLRSIGKADKSFQIHKRALEICLKNYGSKHTFVSLAYKHLGDHFFYQDSFRTALKYYQKSIIAVVGDFNDTSIYSNPSLDSVIFNIRLLDNLKRKSLALEKLADQPDMRSKRTDLLLNSQETITLALELISIIRSDYNSNESKIYLAENEKQTYIYAVHIANTLFKITGDQHYVEMMFNFINQSKSAVLRNEMHENEKIFSKTIPDSLQQKYYSSNIQISSYSKLIQDEYQKAKPDSSRIEHWKDELFSLKREKEKLKELVENNYPVYLNQLAKIEPASLTYLQKKLKKDQTIVEYYVSNTYIDGKRDLYIFIITSKALKFELVKLDSVFVKHSNVIRNIAKANLNLNSYEHYQQYTNALLYMYSTLLNPIEKYVVGNRLTIVPDEEIFFLPFDAFIKERPASNQYSYENLKYLIHEYIISYSYSSSLIFSEKNTRTNVVYAFASDYNNGNAEDFVTLSGALLEIKSINNIFKGFNFSGKSATEANLKTALKNPAIFHFAMHSQLDTLNSNFSYLVLNPEKDSVNDGKFYSYEISMYRIKTPMVVLSACNTASGNLNRGEGVMSLTRSFFLAGAESVVNTFWDVNDVTSTSIMVDFYKNLSKGMGKADALRNAKLNYIKTISPTYLNPKYWAAYEVIGDDSPLKKTNSIFIVFGISLVTIFTGLFLYFKKIKK